MRQGRVGRRTGSWLSAPLAVALVFAAGQPGRTSSDAVLRAPAGDTPAVCGKLAADGRLIRCEHGQPFRWRGATGFRLVHQLATGDEIGASAYLTWARETGFNLVRVLATAQVLFDLPPDLGRQALPAALDLARRYGLYVEVVAVNDSARRSYDWRAHARGVAEICAAASNCLFEFANEPGHGVQDEHLHDMAAVDRLAADAVAGLSVLWTAGPSWDDAGAKAPSGAYVVRHLDRGGTPWEMVRRLRQFEALSEELGKPVVSNEPIGFDETDGAVTGRQRITDCDVALVFGAAGRALEVATTFHLQAGLQNDPPGPAQRRCAEDFIRGTRSVADDAILTVRDLAAADSLVARLDRESIAGLYVGAGRAEGLAVIFGRERDSGIVWRGVASAHVVIDRPAVTVWRLVLRPAGEWRKPVGVEPTLPTVGGKRTVLKTVKATGPHWLPSTGLPPAPCRRRGDWDEPLAGRAGDGRG